MTSALAQEVADLLGQPVTGPDGKPRPLATREVLVAGQALQRAPEVLARYAPNKEVLVVADENTMAAAGDEVEKILDAAGFNFDVAVLRDAEGNPPEADMDVVDGLIDAVDDELELLVAVGSGTLNDLAKLTAFRTNKPYVVISTAPSMNGYTSAIAAMTENGLKRTVACRGPAAVIADLDVLTHAPKAMVRAGFGDLLSKPVSTADWRLSSLITGEPFWDVPGRIVKNAFSQAVSQAAEIGRREPAALDTLTHALLLSGFSMALAGTSSPASGGEHLMSHYWDMMSHHDGRKKALHGEQVGVATLVTATLYQHLQTLDPGDFDVDALVAEHIDPEAYEQDLARRHPELHVVIRDEAMKKYLPADKYRAHITSIINSWDDIWNDLGVYLMAPGVLRDALTAAGAPVSADELGLSRTDVYRTLIRAHDMRARYTVLDLAVDLGLMQDLAEAVIDESGIFV